MRFATVTVVRGAAATGSVTGSARRCLSCSCPADISRPAHTHTHTHTPTAGSVLHARDTAHTPQKSNAKRKLGRMAQGRAPNAARQRTGCTNSRAGRRSGKIRAHAVQQREGNAPRLRLMAASWAAFTRRQDWRRTEQRVPRAAPRGRSTSAQKCQRAINAEQGGSSSSRVTPTSAAALRSCRHRCADAGDICGGSPIECVPSILCARINLPAWPDPTALAPTLAERKN